MPVLTTFTTTAPAAWAGMDEIAIVVEFVIVKQPTAGVEHSTKVVGVPALNSAVVPISTAVAPLRFVPVIVAALPPAAAPLVGLMLVTVGAVGSVPAVAVALAGLPSEEEIVAVVPLATVAEVSVLPVATALTVIVPLVNGLPVVVQEICCPTGAAQVQPVP
jgi:hypothetical protein